MMKYSHTLNQERLAKKWAVLSQQYEAACEQQRCALSAAEKITHQQQIDSLYAQLQEIEAECGQPGPSPAQRSFDVESRLPGIDFQHPEQCFRHILDTIGEPGGAALFFMQNCYPMGGHWFIQRVKDSLKRCGNFREYPVRVSEDLRPDAYGIFSRLAGYFNISLDPDIPDWQQGAAQIIEHLCGQDMVRTNDIIFLEFHGWQELERPGAALDNFIEGFWKPLVRRLPMMTDYEDFKFIAFITADDPLRCQHLPPSVCCAVEDFHAECALELELTTWTCEDVRDLCKFTGRPRRKIASMAQTIYERSQGGIPRFVYTALLDYLKEHSR